MNKPNNQKPAPYVVFGAGETANKALIGFKSKMTSGYELHICETEGNHQIGDGGVLKNGDITGEYFTMYFCKRESLRAMIRVLKTLDDMWVNELLKGTSFEQEDPTIQQAIRKLCSSASPQMQETIIRALNKNSEKSDSETEKADTFRLDPDAETEIDRYLNKT